MIEKTAGKSLREKKSASGVGMKTMVKCLRCHFKQIAPRQNRHTRIVDKAVQTSRSGFGAIQEICMRRDICNITAHHSGTCTHRLYCIAHFVQLVAFLKIRKHEI